MSKKTADLNALILTSSFPCYKGDQTCAYIYNLAAEMKKIGGVKIKVIAPHAPGLAISEEMDGIQVWRFRYFFPYKWQKVAYGSGIQNNLSKNPLLWLQLPFFLFFFFLHTWKRCDDVDIIHAHWLIPAGLIGLIIKKIKKTSLIYTAHSGGIAMIAKVPWGKRLLSSLIRNCNRITAVSQYNKEQIERILMPKEKHLLKKKFFVIPMGVSRKSLWKEEKAKDLTWKDHNIQTDKTVLFIGRLVPIKGVDSIIRAMAGLENVTLVIAGEGTEKKRLEALSRELNVEAVFTGFIGFEAKRNLLNACDLMVLSSVEMKDGRSEAMPVALMEGLSAGLPVVATDVGGVREIIQDNLNGFLVPQGDSAAMREKILCILNDSHLREQMSECARESSQRFDLGLIAKQYNQVYRELIR